MQSNVCVCVCVCVCEYVLVWNVCVCVHACVIFCLVTIDNQSYHVIKEQQNIHNNTILLKNITEQNQNITRYATATKMEAFVMNKPLLSSLIFS